MSVKPEYLTALRVEWVRSGQWKVLEPLLFYSARFSGVYVVTPGFFGNGANVPRWLWSAFPRDGQWFRASFFHDAGLEHRLKNIHGQRVNLIPAYCHDLFAECMAADGCGPKTIALFREAVKQSAKNRPLVDDTALQELRCAIVQAAALGE